MLLDLCGWADRHFPILLFPDYVLRLPWAIFQRLGDTVREMGEIMTYTYVILDVSGETYKEISGWLREHYSQQFHEHEGREVIDMHGIALREKVIEKDKECFSCTPGASGKVEYYVPKFDYYLCREHADLAMIAGWGPVKIEEGGG